MEDKATTSAKVLSASVGNNEARVKDEEFVLERWMMESRRIWRRPQMEDYGVFGYPLAKGKQAGGVKSITVLKWRIMAWLAICWLGEVEHRPKSRGPRSVWMGIC